MTGQQEDGRTVGELARSVDNLVKAFERLESKVDALDGRFVPRETFELAHGANRVDITRTDKRVDDLEKCLDADREKAAARYRATVTMVVTAFVGPIVTAIIAGAVVLK